MSRFGRLIITAFAATSLAACADSPTALTPSPDVLAVSAVRFSDANAAANWNEAATSLASRSVVNVARLYTYLSLAQFRAAEAAEAIRPHPPTSSAIAAASVGVLSAFFPGNITEIEAALDAQEAADPWPGAKHEDFAAGEAIGRAVAARILAWSRDDLVGVTPPIPLHVGPGYWNDPRPPAPGNFGARPFFLATREEFRPPAPPELGSAVYATALAEVRNISDTRTREQIDIAQYWARNQSTTSNAAMNNLAVELIRTYHRGDLESARTLFLMNAAGFDALIGCWEAKFFYSYIRPTQADPMITTVTPLPPHPSYPSGHSCVSGSSTEVLAVLFPSERGRLAAIAEQASLSRLYGGLHYRFDMVAGLELGRRAAAKALAANLDEVPVR